MSKPHVVIVGGGPSGVISAITISKQGYRVVILDRKKLSDIGNKTCGDAIDLAALQRLRDGIGIELPSNDEVSDKIVKMSVAVGTIENKISLDAPGYLVDRHIYGQRLLKQALEMGVEVIDRATVREVIVEDNFVRGVRYLKKGKHEIRANIVIDASGAYAVVRRGLPTSMLQGGLKRDLGPDEQWPSYREIIELNEEHEFLNEIILKYDEDYPPPGYFWIFSKGKKRLNVGIGWAKSQQNLGPMKDAFLKEMVKYYPRDSYKVIQQGGGQIPFRIPFDNLVFNGGALVGDAACMVHPITAEGHGPALDTAWRLGKVVVKSLEKEDYSIGSLWQYNIDVSKHYGRKHTEAEIIRRMIEKVGVQGMKFLFGAKAFKEEELNLIFSGGTLKLSKMEMIMRVLRLLRKPSLLYELKHTFTKVNRSKKHYAKYPENIEKLDSWRETRNQMLDMNY